MNPRRTARRLLAAIAIAGCGAVLAAKTAGVETTGGKERGANPSREYIYGAELMTPQERERYRTRLRKAHSEGKEDAERDGHRRQIRERARQQGITLEEPAGVLRRPESSR